MADDGSQRTEHSEEQASDTRETLTLSDALKLSGMVETGGQAKALIQEGHVRVNGEVERRRKRRVGAGDEIDVDGESFVLELLEDAGEGDAASD